MRSALIRAMGRALCSGAMLAATSALAQPASASTSTRPIHIVVGFTPGGAPGRCSSTTSPALAATAVPTPSPRPRPTA